MITTVIIPVLNRYDLLARCLSSLPPGIPNVLVIDNGNGVPEEAVWPVARVLRMPSNLGVPTSWNLGIKLYPHEPGWLLLNSDARFSDGAWDAFARDCGEDRITLAGSPPWCCAWIGRGVVERVGLFCEQFYPAYMEDIDYERRARAFDVPVIYSGAAVQHDNSSTIQSDPRLMQINAETHARNARTFHRIWHDVPETGVPAHHEWDIRIRCANSWDA